MAEYLTNDNELTLIANAIRNKSGVTSQLTYPDEFISTINGITTVSPKLATITVSIPSDSSIDPRFIRVIYISQDKKLINETSTSSIPERTSPFNIQTIQDSLLFIYYSGSGSGIAVATASGVQHSTSSGRVYLIPQAEVCTCELYYPGD